MKKKYKIILTLILIMIVLSIFLLVYSFFIKSPNDNMYESIDTISKFGYTLDDRDTKVMKDKFNELKTILEKEEINYDEYAEKLSELFVIDLYTLDNKYNKYDVGSLEYVYPDYIDTFKIKVMDTLYKYIEDKTINENREDYTEVSDTIINKIEKSTYTYKEESMESFIVSLSWNYVNDFGYDKSAKVTLVQNDEKLYVVNFEGVTEDDKNN